MIDGVSGVDLLNTLLSPTPDREPLEEHRFIPRRTPSPFELWRDEMLRRVQLPASILRDVRHFVEDGVGGGEAINGGRQDKGQHDESDGARSSKAFHFVPPPML